MRRVHCAVCYHVSVVATPLPFVLLALMAAGLGYAAYRQWGTKGALAVLAGAATFALAAFWPRKRPTVAPPPATDLKPVQRAAEVMITRREDKARKAIREADADELAAKMQGQE